MDWDEAVELCDEILALCEKALARDDIPNEGLSFVEDVEEGVSSMKETIEDRRRLTDAQARALDNWKKGVEAWL